MTKYFLLRRILVPSAFSSLEVTEMHIITCRLNLEQKVISFFSVVALYIFPQQNKWNAIKRLITSNRELAAGINNLQSKKDPISRQILLTSKQTNPPLVKQKTSRGTFKPSVLCWTGCSLSFCPLHSVTSAFYTFSLKFWGLGSPPTEVSPLSVFRLMSGACILACTFPCSTWHFINVKTCFITTIQLLGWYQYSLDYFFP